MTIDIWHVFTVILSLTALTIGFFAIRNRDNGNSRFSSIPFLLGRIDDLEKRIVEKDQRIEELKTIIEQVKIDSAKVIVDLEHKLDGFRDRVAYLESLLYSKDSTAEEYNKYVRPNLLLITADDQIQRADEIALNRARVPYRRITNATARLIEEEFRRRRSENQMYEHVVFSAHMNESGILLSDGDILPGYWLNLNLSGVELVILNGCESTGIADDVAGVVNYVISLSEKIPNDSASSFLTAFWRKMKVTNDIVQAYGYAKSIEPEVSKYVDIQIRG